MKLLICLITHNRLKYSQRTLRELLRTIEIPYFLVAVDNASTDGTVDWLEGHVKRYKIDKVILSDDNLYPGAACNMGWHRGLEDYPEATHLMRLDNDMHFEKGWDARAEEYFKKIPELGQLGLDHEAIEHPKAILREQEINGCTINTWPGCVGGPCIIRRTLWDKGLRYDELRWDDERRSKLQEDSRFSKKIENMGYIFGHMTDNLSRTFANESNWHEFPEYYKKTMRERGYDENLEKI